MFRTVLVSGSAKSATETCLKGSKKLVTKNLTAKSSSRRLLSNVAALNNKHTQLLRTNQSTNLIQLNDHCKFNRNVRSFCSSNLPSHIKVALPALSPTMEMGTIVSWEKQEGDRLAEGDLLAEIETDKATMGFETPEEGFLAKVLVPAGEKNVPLGKLLCIIVENEEDIAAFKDYQPTPEDDQVLGKSSQAPAQSQPTSTPPAPQQTVVSPVSAPQQSAPQRQMSARLFASPLARSLAAAKGIDLTQLQGTGPNGRILANDLQNAQANLVGLTSPSSYSDQETSAIRQTIAKRLSLSKQSIPHYYLTVEIEVDELIKIREQMNSMLAKENIKLSINDFIIKAAALACKKVPEANSSWQETFIRQYNDVDVSIAVSTDSGLITPIVFKANELGVKEISQQVKNLASKARDGKLQPSEYQGGTFTISNLGSYGINNFSAIINPPQSCILAIGTVEQRVVPNANSKSDEDKLKIANLLKVTLSCDHRTVDGAVGAKWLQAFTMHMNQPFTMVL